MTNGALVLRPQVIDLARSMETKLAQNDHKRPWDTYGPEHAYWLLAKLAEEVEELREAMLRGTGDEIELEAADVANFALFIHSVARRHGPIGEPQ